MKILLKTSFSCLVRTQNDFAELNENDILEIEDEGIIFVYPEDNAKIPFYVNLNCPKESDRLSFIKENGKTVLLLEDLSVLKVSHKENLNFSGKNCQIIISDNNLCFETESKKISYACPHSCKNYKVFKLKNFACVQFEKDLYAFSVSKNKLSHFGGDIIEIDKESLRLQKKFHDSISREKTAVYKFGDEISLEKETFMYNKDDKFSEELLPYKILESVKSKDYAFVFDSLSEKLKQQIDINQIKEFFGNISSFLPVSTTEFITLSNQQKNFVKFVIKNGKADDIIVDNL